MRLLMSAMAAPGHLLPLLPFADAARDAGHEVAFLTAANMALLLGSRPLLAAGPDVATLLAETQRRTAGGDARHPGAAAVENFAGARVDLAWEDSLEQARTFAPDLLVCETTDFVGPMIAAALNVAWIHHTIVAPLPADLTEPMQQRSAQQHHARGLIPRPRVAVIDTLPDPMRTGQDPMPDIDRIPMRPLPYFSEQGDYPLPVLDDDLPRVAITVGTSVHDPDLLAELVRGTAAAGVEVLVTATPEELALPADPHVHCVGFFPLSVLLPAVDAVVGAGGMGTVLATVAAGLPAVLRPVVADQPWNAERVTGLGLGVRIENADEVQDAVRKVLDVPSYRTAAAAVAHSMAMMDPPDVVLAKVRTRAGL